MSSNAGKMRKKEIILVPGSKVTVEEAGGKYVLTIYKAVNEPELVIILDEFSHKSASIKDKSTVNIQWDYKVPFESIEQYKSILRGEYHPKK